VPSRRRCARSLLAVAIGLASLLLVFQTLSTAFAFAEESLKYYDPFESPRVEYDTDISSVHFDLMGALAIAAGFSEDDAKLIQVYSQLVDSEELSGTLTRYTYYADPASYLDPPPLSSVVTSTYCPSPTQISDSVTLGNFEVMSDMMKCPGCFTSRYGPFGVFFHEPHDRPDELGAIREWAFGRTDVLTGMVIFGYSSTAKNAFMGVANIYESTACFISRTVPIDTGGIQAGSLEALATYLHSLGDHWSHLDCLNAADAEGKLFGAHVTAQPNDPLWPCRWTDHEAEFGAPLGLTRESNRTFTGTLAMYDALVQYGQFSGRARYRPIPLNAEGSYLYNNLYTLVHTTTVLNPQPRRDIADSIRAWSLQTRTKPQYQKYQLYLPVVTRN